MTYDEYKNLWEKLSEKQRKWVKSKARWEHISPWAVLNDWTVPLDNELNSDGTYDYQAKK